MTKIIPLEQIFGTWGKNPNFYTSALTESGKAYRKMRNKMAKKSRRMNRKRRSLKGCKTL